VSRETKRNSRNEDYDFAGYKASHSLELRLPLEKERLNKVMEALLGSKSNAHITISFAVADPEPVRNRLFKNPASWRPLASKGIRIVQTENIGPIGPPHSFSVCMLAVHAQAHYPETTVGD
jgi:hypothetical protein